MPFVYVSLHKGTTPEYRRAVSDGIHEAMQAVLREVQPDDRHHVFLEHDPANMLYDPTYLGVARSPQAVFIQMFFNARPPELKKALFEAIADRLVQSPGLRRDDVLQMVVEPAPENWWATGRQVNPATGFAARGETQPPEAGTQERGQEATP